VQEEGARIARRNNKAMKTKITAKTTTLNEKKNTTILGEKRQHPFMQIFRVCRKEPSNLTLSFHSS
jgi:hypothetical protein